MMSDSNNIELYRCRDEAIKGSIDRFTVEIHNRKKEKGDKVLLFTGAGKQSGNTTITINTAISLADNGYSTLLIDCDLRKLKEQKKLAEGIDTGLSEYLSEDVDFANIVCKTNIDNLEYISAGECLSNEVGLLSSKRMEDMFSNVKEDYDYIILDLPAISIVPDATLLFSNVDGIILVAAMNKVSKKQLRSAKAKVIEQGDKYYGLMINEIDISQYKSYIRDYDYFSKSKLMQAYIRNKSNQ